MIALCVKRWLRRNGTSRVPYKKMAKPERDEPRSLQNIRVFDYQSRGRLPCRPVSSRCAW
jgi:hypothetical protein